MDKRAAFRFPTNVETNCQSNNRGWSSQIRNISTTGCMITRAELDLVGGSLVRMRISGWAAIDGEIMWLNRGRAGVKFRAPIPPAMMERLAFRDTDRGYDPPPATPQAPAPSVVHRAPSVLHGRLVKRAQAPDKAATRQTSAA